MELDKKEIRTFFIYVCLMCCLMLALGFAIGQKVTDDQWSDYHEKYRESIMAHCDYDPENPKPEIPDYFSTR